ncbi:type I restriction enzyme HsdR N-terminal domain-containing protein [Prevotella dentasini]
MIQLNLPQYKINIQETDGKKRIFDILRRRFVVLTPEEWVRQHFIHFLVEHKGYPSTLLANEVALQVGDKTVRADSVLYDRELHPRMIAEYKAPHIPITQKVFDQISVYNLLLHVDYLVVSNGMQTYACKMDYQNMSYTFLEDIPSYENI